MAQNSDRDNSSKALGDAAIQTSVNQSYLDVYLVSLVNLLKQVSGLDLQVKYSEGIFKKLIGDLPFLNHIHGSSAKVRQLSVTVGGKIYEIKSEPSLTCSIMPSNTIELADAISKGANHIVKPSSWAKELVKSVEENSQLTNKFMNEFEHLVLDSNFQD